MPSLPDMPELVMNHILDFCDVRSIFSLRKVSHNLRNHIDDVIPPLHLSEIKFEVREGCLLLVLSDDIDIKYESFSRMCYENDDDDVERKPVERKGCKVECNNMKHFLEGENFMDIFRSDFELLLEFQKTGTLERIVLQWCDDEDSWAIRSNLRKESIKCLEEKEKLLREVVMNPLKAIFEGFNAKQDVPLKARTFETRGVLPKEAKSLLKLFQAGTLKCIKIHDPYFSQVRGTHRYNANYRNPNYILSLSGIEDLDQWKQADELDIEGFHVMAAKYLVDSFGHFSRGKVELSGATGDEIFNLMQAFLRSPNFQNFELTIPQSIVHSIEEYSRVTELTNVLGPARVSRRGEQDRRRVFEWTLRNSDSDVALVLVYSPQTSFQFYRTQ